MHRRVSVAVLAILGLIGLRALAAASPPDPIWSPGLYDDADEDDVVVAALDLYGSRDDFSGHAGSTPFGSSRL
jgi:hypothetical protein